MSNKWVPNNEHIGQKLIVNGIPAVVINHFRDILASDFKLSVSIDTRVVVAGKIEDGIIELFDCDANNPLILQT